MNLAHQFLVLQRWRRERFTAFKLADTAFRARLARAMIDKTIDQKTHNELFELYDRSLIALADEAKGIVDRATTARPAP